MQLEAIFSCRLIFRLFWLYLTKSCLHTSEDKNTQKKMKEWRKRRVSVFATRRHCRASVRRQWPKCSFTVRSDAVAASVRSWLCNSQKPRHAEEFAKHTFRKAEESLGNERLENYPSLNKHPAERKSLWCRFLAIHGLLQISCSAPPAMKTCSTILMTTIVQLYSFRNTTAPLACNSFMWNTLKR